jgi:uncharacterized SAM-binding protein YcdF (DUF218 family)
LNTFIVVPDGLAADDRGNPLLKPSFVFRPVLEATAALTQESDTVYVAPGNNFGATRYEQEVAADYLRTLKPTLIVIAPVITTRGYIDTFGNAEFLKPSLKHDIASTRFVLMCTQIHSLRAELCFRMAGYKLLRVERVRYPSDREPVVRRLWYYRYPIAYFTYEILALLRELVRFLTRLIMSRRDA